MNIQETRIEYTGGYKYQLNKDFAVYIPIHPVTLLKSGHWIRLHSNGLLKIRHGYAWDGPSGWTIDTKSFMRGSLIHDSLYQLMREGQLDQERYRQQIDMLLRENCQEDGMNSFRAWYVYKAVRVGGRKSSSAAGIKPILLAP